MKHLPILLFFLMTFLSSSLHSQDTTYLHYFSKSYTATYDTNNVNLSIRGIIPNEEGYLGIGSYFDSLRRLHIRQLDKKGETQWIKYLVIDSLYSQFERGANIIENPDGSMLLGYTKYKAIFGQDRDVHFLKIDETGEILWEVADTVPDQKYIRQLIRTQDGGYVYIGGQQDIQGMSPVNGYIAKYSSEGIKEWENTYSMPGNWVDFNSVFESSSGHLFVGGFGETTDTNLDRVTLKYSSIGVLLEERIDDNDVEDCGSRVLYEESSETFYLLSCQGNNIDRHFYLARLDTSLTLLWDSLYTSFSIPSITQPGSRLVLKPDGGFVTLMRNYQEDGWDQPAIADFNAEGDINWIKSYKSVSGKHIYAHDLRKIEGGYVVAAYEHWGLPQRGWVFTIDSLGNTCSNLGCDSSIVVHIDSTMTSLLEAKYLSPFQVYPNPLESQELHVQVPLSLVGEPVAFELYDLYGRQVALLHLYVSQRNQVLSLPYLPTGIYSYQIRDKDQKILHTGKLVKQ